MNEIEKRLKELQRRGYETIEMGMILQWIAEIRRDNRLKAHEQRGKNKKP